MKEEYDYFIKNKSFFDESIEEKLRDKYNKYSCNNLDQCVQEALYGEEHKTVHLAFAKYFLTQCESSNSLYMKKEEKYFEERFVGNWKKLRVYKDWNKLEDVNKIKEKSYYGFNYLSEKNRSRIAIMQIGFCLRLSIRQLNELLNMKDEPALYPLDIIDILFAFWMKDNKEEMNVKISVQEAQEMLDSFYLKSRKELKDFYEKNTQIIPLLRGGWAYSEMITETVKENKEEWIIDEKKKEYMNAVTNFYNEKFSKCQTVEEFLNTTFFPIFGCIRYRLTEMKESYVNNTEKYEKNFYYSKSKLDKNDGYGYIMAERKKERRIFRPMKSKERRVATILKYCNLLEERSGDIIKKPSTAYHARLIRSGID